MCVKDKKTKIHHMLNKCVGHTLCKTGMKTKKTA